MQYKMGLMMVLVILLGAGTSLPGAIAQQQQQPGMQQQQLPGMQQQQQQAVRFTITSTRTSTHNHTVCRICVFFYSFCAAGKFCVMVRASQCTHPAPYMPHERDTNATKR